LTCKEKKSNERKKLGELQAKLEGIKINKDVALKSNKSSKLQLAIPKHPSKFKK
jgi:hypothetical protein